MQGITVTLEELLALRYVVSQFNLPQQRLSKGAEQGNFQSPFRGRGMDFVETRVYQPGDDIRSINWAVTARTGKPHTKIYQQERERPLYIIVDFSPSLFFGTRNAFKSVIAAQAAALIAWTALKNNDRVGALLIKDTVQFLPASNSKQNVMALLKNLVSYTEHVSPAIADYRSAFTKLKKIIKSGSLVYFLSDFYSLDNTLKNELQQVAQKNEMTNILIYDPLEKTAPKQGSYLFYDHSKNESLMLETYSRNFCSLYDSIFEQRVNLLKKFCFETGMHLIELCTTDDMIHILRHVLNRKR